MSRQKKTTESDELFMKTESVWLKMKKREKSQVFRFSDDYRKFLKEAKTERETVSYIISLAEKHGFKSHDVINKVSAGDKFYINLSNRAAALVVVGKQAPLKNGVKIVASHVDSPRLDLKIRPLIEDSDSGVAMFKTQYYGGIKKYHWVNIPLAIHGVVYTKDNEMVDIVIGEKETEPVFVIPDLLPHLARRVQYSRKLYEGIKGEELTVVIGSIPVDDKDIKDKIKYTVLKYLKDKYNITEKDFLRADIELVPAYSPRDVGFDGGIIGAYGHDDRVCTYALLRSILDIETPETTSIAMFYDKEEIGSEGKTSAQSRFIDYVFTTLCQLLEGKCTYGDFLEIAHRSSALSADVDAVLDPIFKDVHDPLNAARMGQGVIITKYTGYGGKYDSSEADASFMAEIMRLFDKHGVKYQTGVLGKVDEGGGGTIAKFLAKYGMNVLDVGTGVLSMHSPFELVSKADVWYTYKAYLAFYKD